MAYLVERSTEYANEHNAYCSITTLPQYQNQSFEEIRLHDHATGRYGRHYFAYATANLPSNAGRSTQLSPSFRCSPNGSRKMGNAMVSFQVGSNPTKNFDIHEGVVTPRSEFVRLALQGNWKEAKERAIPLPDDSPAVFSIYQQWLYSGLLHTRDADTTPDAMNEFELLVRAYIFGEKFMDSNFKDTVVDAIVDKLRTQQRFDLRLTDLVFDNTPAHSQLRRLWMDAYYWAGCAEWLDEDFVNEPINPDFMIEFSRFQMRQRQSQAPNVILEACNYHEHGMRNRYRKDLLALGVKGVTACGVSA